MALAVNILKEQIEKAKENLKTVDEDIKKITGRDPNEQRPNDGRRMIGTGRGRGSILGRRTSFNRPDMEEPPTKRTSQSKVFARLGPAGGRRRVVISGKHEEEKDQEEEEEEDDEEDSVKRSVQSSVVSTAKKITKTELINAQNVGEKGKARNRRMFGVLMGTLARFQSRGTQQQTKQEQRQKEIEQRLEEQSSQDRKRLATERRTLFNERRAQQKRIQLLEQKIALADELAEWEKEWEKKSKFIMTKASPPVFFTPKEATPSTDRALKESEKRIKDIIVQRTKSVGETMKLLDEEIKMLENRSGNNHGNGNDSEMNGKESENKGGDAVVTKKGNTKIDEPEEEMDLDSMGPQVDIKVEMDDSVGGEGKVMDCDQPSLVEIKLDPGKVSSDQIPAEQDEDEGDVGIQMPNSEMEENAAKEPDRGLEPGNVSSMEKTPQFSTDKDNNFAKTDQKNDVMERHSEVDQADEDVAECTDVKLEQTPPDELEGGKSSPPESQPEQENSELETHESKDDTRNASEAEEEVSKKSATVETEEKPEDENSSSEEEGPVKGPTKPNSEKITKKVHVQEKKRQSRDNSSSESSSEDSSSSSSSSSADDERRKKTNARDRKPDSGKSSRRSESRRSRGHSPRRSRGHSPRHRTQRSSSRSRSRDRRTSRSNRRRR